MPRTDEERAATEAHFAAVAGQHRQELAAMIAKALADVDECNMGPDNWMPEALAVHDALRAEGVVFASLTPCDHPGWDD